jgi:hypothetical protein
MRTLLVGAATAMLTVSVAAAAPGAAKQRTLVTREPVIALAADGDRAAFVVFSPCGYFETCARLKVWEHNRRRVIQLTKLSRTSLLALAGTRVAWPVVGGTETVETIVATATLARPTPVRVAFVFSNRGGDSGAFVRPPLGDGTLLAFTVERRCDFEEGSTDPCPPGGKRGDIIAATVWRVAGRGQCPGTDLPRRCTPVAQAEGELTVLAVDAGRIAVRTDSGVRLLTAGGDILQEFDVMARRAALSGNRLAVRTADAIKVYDTSSGELTARFPAPPRLTLQDFDGGILVTAAGRAVTLRMLSDRRTTTIRFARFVRAQLERPGLFVAAGRRVMFTPMRDVLRRLGGA